MGSEQGDQPSALSTCYQLAVTSGTHDFSPQVARRCCSEYAAELQFKQALGVRDPVVLNLYTGSFLAQTGGNVLLGWSSYPWDVAALPAQDGVSLFFESLPGECVTVDCMPALTRRLSSGRDSADQCRWQRRLWDGSRVQPRSNMRA